MRAIRFGLGLLVVFALMPIAAPNAYAIFYQDDPNSCDRYEDCAYGSPDWTYSNPTTTQCVAKKSANQRCRDCVEAYDLKTGQPKGITCGIVPNNAACKCNWNPACSPSGSCDYSWY